jgi:glycosyltransferase involved in cell wall biosynthesis
MSKIVFVIPWYGEDLKGGAEQFAWQFSHRLAERGHQIEVFSTCCESFLSDWSVNALSSDIEKISENLLVRRFVVDKRDASNFNHANEELLSVPKESLSEFGFKPHPKYSEAFVKDNINSTAMEHFVSKNSSSYDAFIFIPYLYGTTLNIFDLVADKAYLHPCLHDEVYAYIDNVANTFYQAKGLIYNSKGEADLAIQIYGPGIANKGAVVGGGVEVDLESTHKPSDFLPSEFDLSTKKYLLYLGRRDKTKNVNLLIAAYLAFRQANPTSVLELVLAGPGDQCFDNKGEGIYDFGLVSEETKRALIQACVGLVQPSSNESYSRTIMEAWLYEKPVGVNAECNATYTAVCEANGGVSAAGIDEWTQLIAWFDTEAIEILSSKGRNGAKYARSHASWDVAIDKYERILGLIPKEPLGGHIESTVELKAIHQLTAGFSNGDAISNQALSIQEIIRSIGIESEIYTESMDVKCTGASLFRMNQLDSSNGYIYHHSIGADLSSAINEFTGAKAFLYHNVTPSHFYVPYDLGVADLLEAGREELQSSANSYNIVYGDSEHNCEELAEASFINPSVLPIIVDPADWGVELDSSIADHLADGKTNILFVGRISPNKCQHDLVNLFNQYLKKDDQSRLILVGGYRRSDRYYNDLKAMIQALGLSSKVLVAGKVTQKQLQTYYSRAHVFVSMSEHEGFGVPLVESMWFDIPVLAYQSTAVPETLAAGGILFDDKSNLKLLAAMVHRIVSDQELRGKIIVEQRKRREDFLPVSIEPVVKTLLKRLIDAGAYK